MISLVQITEDARGLALAYPLWSACALAALTLALVGFAVLGRAFDTLRPNGEPRRAFDTPRPNGEPRRRWPLSLAIVFSAWAAIYVATYYTRIGAEAGSAYAFLRYDDTVRWEDAADIYLEHATGGDWRIVVIDRERRAHRFEVAGLSVEDRDRVMSAMVDRMPAGAFRRAPELMTRRAPTEPRPESFLSDQQI